VSSLDVAQPLHIHGGRDVHRAHHIGEPHRDLLVLGRCCGNRNRPTHSLQNFEFGGSSVPHDPHTTVAAVMSRGQLTVVPRLYRVTAGETNVDPYRRCDPANG
jgi:hypothetical protein